MYAHLVTGGITDASALANIARHIGFKLNGSELLGTVADGTDEETLLLETFTVVTHVRNLEVVYTPSVEARFYIDGIDKGAITDHLPSSSVSSAYMLNGSVSNTATGSKVIGIYECRTLQEE